MKIRIVLQHLACGGSANEVNYVDGQDNDNDDMTDCEYGLPDQSALVEVGKSIAMMIWIMTVTAS